MKKIIIFFLVLLVGKGFGQSDIPPFPENFGTGFSFPASFDIGTSTSDWIIEDGSSGIPVSTGVGSSGGSMFLGTNVSSSSLEEVRTVAISTSTYVNIQVKWNVLKASASSPSVTFSWSKDAGATWSVVAYSNTSGINTWGGVPTITLPAAASATNIILRWSYTSTGSGGFDYVAIDDVKITGTPVPSFYYKGTGDLSLTSSWGQNTDGSGPPPGDFSSGNQNFFLRNASSATLTSDWSITGSNSFLNVGDGTALNQFNLVIPASFSLGLFGGAIVNVTNSSSLTIFNTTFPGFNNVELGTNSTVNFAQSSAVTLWAANYGNLILSGTGDRMQPNANISVAGIFSVGSSNNYVMVGSAFRLTRLSGQVLCSGNITTGVSHLTIDGSGSIGTVNFNGVGNINNLTLNRPGQILSLGASLGVNGITTLTSGTVSLNGNLLAMSGAVVFPSSASNGVFIGSATSSISILGNGTLTNGLLMDQSTAAARTAALTMNRASVTLILGADLISNSSTFTNGNININGRSLTLTGAITFPTSAASSFIGSATSSLTIDGSGAIANSMFMSQTNAASKSLGLLIMNRSGSILTLGNNLIVDGTSNFPAGIVDINGTHLTLSGPITFPSLVANRGFRGSITSSLTIDGSGSISNSLLMNSGNIILEELTMNRNTTLTLGNTLETYGSIFPNAGTIAANGNLFVRSNATKKGRIAAVLGAITGNVRVETFAAGGVTDWTNLGVSGVQAQTLANWDGQIPMSCLGCINDQTSAGGYFVSVQSWDETAVASSSVAYVEATSGTPLSPGKGFWTYLGNNIGSTSDITWTVTGAPVVGPVSVPLSYSGPSNGDGFNLISNPFPSPISWASVLASNPTYTSTLDNVIYVYNPDLGSTTSYVSGVPSGTVAGGITDNIPMGQAFYVQTTATPFTLTFQESNKVKSNAPLLKTANDIGSVLWLNVSGGGFYDGTAIRFHEDATPSYDRKWDARKLYSSPGYLGYPGIWNQRTTISTLSNDEDYSVNSLPYAHSADAVIPVLVKVYATGQHTITGTDLENLPNSCVILKDKLLNTTHDLKTGGYVCNISDTTTTPRFELRICMDVAMNVEENNSVVTDKSIVINNDENGVYVKFDYEQPTKSKISITNILGQKIVDDKSLTTVNDKVYLNLDPKQQLVFVTVSTDTKKVTKKVVR